MKKQSLLSLVCLAGGIAAFLLRLLQNKTGFEGSTGLPVSGNLFALLLPPVLLVFAVALAVLAREPKSAVKPVFPEDFSTKSSALLSIPVAGILMMGLSGMLLALANISPDTVPVSGGSSPQVQLLFGATALIPALALLSAFSACRQQGARESSLRVSRKYDPATLLLIPPVGLVIRLVLSYRIYSIDPVLERYYVELLALVFMTLAFYRLSSFAFQAGNPFRFTLYAGLAVILSCAALADGGALPDLLFYAGGAVTLLGALLMQPQTPHRKLSQ